MAIASLWAETTRFFPHRSTAVLGSYLWCMRGRNRRAFAVTTALLWLLGVEVLPSLHLASHRDDHTHAADGSIVATDYDRELERLHQLAHAQRGHDHHHHHHGDAHPDHAPKPKPRRDQLAYHAASGHAAGGIAHHATALHRPPPPDTAPVITPVAQPWRHDEPTDRIASTYEVRPSARGPPTT